MTQAVHSCLPPSKQLLSHDRQQLVELMQRVGYGYVDGLRVVAGELQSNPRPRVKRIVALGRGNGPKLPRDGDFALKGTVSDLFRHLDAIVGSATISVAVQDGLPIRLTIDEDDDA